MRIEEIKSHGEMFFGIAVSRRGRRYKWYWMVDMFKVIRHEPCPGSDWEFWSYFLTFRQPNGRELLRRIAVPALRIAVEKAIRQSMH
jgi:hypothetical protein